MSARCTNLLWTDCKRSAVSHQRSAKDEKTRSSLPQSSFDMVTSFVYLPVFAES